MNNDADRTVSKYLDAWNETDVTRRRVALASLFTDDCEYTDPLAVANGQAGLDRLIENVQQQLPGFKFSLADRVDSHHEQVRFTWQAAPEGATEAVVVGFDVLVLRAGRISRVYGFLDKVPG